MIDLTYPQEFALLALKFFSPERPGSVIRVQTLQSLVRLGLATRHDNGSFSITPRGIAVNDMTPPAGWEPGDKTAPENNDRIC